MTVFIYMAYLTCIICYATLLFEYNIYITRKSNSQRTYMYNKLYVFIIGKTYCWNFDIDFLKKMFFINLNSLFCLYRLFIDIIL